MSQYSEINRKTVYLYKRINFKIKYEYSIQPTIRAQHNQYVVKFMNELVLTNNQYIPK